jgi:hypothetical protein
MPESPKERPFLKWLIQIASVIGAAALAALLARWGIPVPPLPPITVEPPPIILPTPPTPPNPPAPETKPDPFNAIAKLSFPGVGCSATVIGPRRPDGRWWVLTASHCCKGPGQHGTIRFRSGKTVGVVVQHLDRTPDYAWMLTETNGDDLPYTTLAPETPPVGSPIWHAGYGVDVPGNVEKGSILQLPDNNGQIRMRLSVSSGDSGGGICLDSDGRVVSCVCCTSGIGRLSDVWGTSVEAARKGQIEESAIWEWTPSPVPIRTGPKK